MSLTSKFLLPAAFSAVFFAACGDSSSTSAGGISDKSIQGVSQKGPFVTGSSVKLFELDGASIGQTGRSFTGKITSDKGEFNIPNVSLNSPYALLEATGYYRNEVTGRKSAGTITLNALTDLSNRENVNVNLLTHLEYERALKLVGDGLSVAEAKKQAETEIFAAFGIQGEFANSEDLNIFSDNEGDAALLAFSVLMQGNLTEAELTERLTKFSMDISVDGVWDDAETKTIIADWARDVDFGEVLGIIRGNINSWGLGTTPAFEKYVRNFWYAVSGLEECTEEKEGDILANSNLQSKLYKAKERFICKSGLWVVASGIEKDTYKHECLTDGSAFKGDVNTSMKYMCDDGVFRLLTSLEIELDSACSSYNREAIVLNKTKDKAYVCTENKWTYDEYYGLEKPTDGSLQQGLNSKKYVYDGSDFRFANKLELQLNHGCTSYSKDVKVDEYMCEADGWHYVDARDGQSYLTLLIGEQVWMSKNLNYETDGSYCYNDSVENCAKYGRLYSWDAAMSACPTGWHLPSNEEWDELFIAVGEMDFAGWNLKSTSGWDGGNGSDSYGFGVLIAGRRDSDGGFYNTGYDAYFWGSTESSSDDAYYWSFDFGHEGVSRFSRSKDYGYSVRCLKDN